MPPVGYLSITLTCLLLTTCSSNRSTESVRRVCAVDSASLAGLAFEARGRVQYGPFGGDIAWVWYISDSGRISPGFANVDVPDLDVFPHAPGPDLAGDSVRLFVLASQVLRSPFDDTIRSVLVGFHDARREVVSRSLRAGLMILHHRGRRIDYRSKPESFPHLAWQGSLHHGEYYRYFSAVPGNDEVLRFLQDRDSTHELSNRLLTSDSGRTIRLFSADFAILCRESYPEAWEDFNGESALRLTPDGLVE